MYIEIEGVINKIKVNEDDQDGGVINWIKGIKEEWDSTYGDDVDKEYKWDESKRELKVWIYSYIQGIDKQVRYTYKG